MVLYRLLVIKHAFLFPGKHLLAFWSKDVDLWLPLLPQDLSLRPRSLINSYRPEEQLHA
jgi:hypothetical protein